MGKMTDIQELMETRLQAQDALAGIPVIIDRQQDLARQIETELAKLKLCIVLYSAEAIRQSGRRAGDPYRLRIIAEIYGRPLLQPAAGALSATVPDVAEEVAKAVDGWRPEADDHFFEEWSVPWLAMVPDAPGLLVWRVTVDCGEVRIF